MIGKSLVSFLEGGGGGRVVRREVVGRGRLGRVKEEKKEKSGWVRGFLGALFSFKGTYLLVGLDWEVDRGGEFWGLAE